MMRILMGMAGGVPVMVLAVALYVQRWRRKSAGHRLPTEEKLLRPAGCSLSKEIEELTQGYQDMLFIAFMCALVATGALAAPAVGGSDQLVLFAVFGGACAVVAVMAWRKLEVLRVKKMGLLGEQTMGELLGRLARTGYRVFHDVPGGENSKKRWNVDHIAIGPGGIFAIETKCRTKRPVKGKPDHEVSFDGQVIRFPGYSDFETVAQARRNAEWVAKEFSEAVGQDLTVKAVVALPGWFVVDPKKEWPVWVLSGKMVPDWIEKEPQKLSEQLIRRIAYQLDRRCRDVEL